MSYSVNRIRLRQNRRNANTTRSYASSTGVLRLGQTSRDVFFVVLDTAAKQSFLRFLSVDGVGVRDYRTPKMRIRLCEYAAPSTARSVICESQMTHLRLFVITNNLRKNRQGIASDLRPPPPSAMQSHHRLLIRFTRGVRTLRLPLGIVQQETFFTLRSPSSHLRDKTT